MNDYEWMRLVLEFTEVEIQSLRVRHECGRDDIAGRIDSCLGRMRSLVGNRHVDTTEDVKAYHRHILDTE